MLVLVALPLSLTVYGMDLADAGLIMATSTATLVAVRPLMRMLMRVLAGAVGGVDVRSDTR